MYLSNMSIGKLLQPLETIDFPLKSSNFVMSPNKPISRRNQYYLILRKSIQKMMFVI